MKLFGTNNLTLVDEDLSSVWSKEPPTATVMSFKDDPIALSCASYRHWLVHPNTRWLDLESVVATEEDRKKASELKSYYRARIVWDQLKHGGTLSEFRAKLGRLVSGELQITTKEVGMIYRLPYFYAEDCGLDCVIEQTSDDVVQRRSSTPVEQVTARYKLIQQVFKSRRSGDSMQYWLKSDFCSAPCLITVDYKNPLRLLLDSVLTQPDVQLKSFLFPQQHRGYHRSRHYFQLGNVELA